jgi:hypothetical protein
MVKGKQE